MIVLCCFGKYFSWFVALSTSSKAWLILVSTFIQGKDVRCHYLEMHGDQYWIVFKIVARFIIRLNKKSAVWLFNIRMCEIRWRAVASWHWVANDDSCGICRMPFDGCCNDCKSPGDDCPLGRYDTWSTLLIVLFCFSICACLHCRVKVKKVLTLVWL